MVFFLIVLSAEKLPREELGLFFRSSEEESPSLRVRYRGEGRDLFVFGTLGSELFSLPRDVRASQVSEFFLFLKSLGEWGSREENSFSLQGHLFWNERENFWEGFIWTDLAMDLEKDNSYNHLEQGDLPPFRSVSLSGETLFFSPTLSEKRAQEFMSEYLVPSWEKRFPFLEWNFSDGGFFRKEFPSLFRKPLLFQGNFSLFSGKGCFYWDLESSEIFSEEIQNLPLWKKQVRYTPMLIPSPLIAEGGCSDMGSLVFLAKKALALDTRRKEDRFIPEKWSSLIEKGLARFSSVSLPLAFVVGGKSKLFQTFLPGVLLHFPEGGEKACIRVEALWKRISFFLKPKSLQEKTLCGGFASSPVSLLITAMEGETLGGFITEDSFTHAKLQKSRYSLFFGETPSLAWFILDIPMLHKSIGEFFLEEKILGQIPFRFLPMAYTVSTLGSQLSSLGVLGCAFWGEGKGEFIFSGDFFQ